MDLIQIESRQKPGCTIKIRKHELVCDLNAADGGKDLGPSPAELLTASLGACVVVMVAAYCRQHGYCDGPVAVSATYELGGDPKTIRAITMDLEIPRDVPEEKKEAVRRLVEKCPIKQTLACPPQIDLEIR